jgi:hypothetical protein
MLPVFLARVKPASHMAKPACIKKTSAAPSRTQMVLTDEYIVFPPKSPRAAAARHAAPWNKYRQGRL